MPRGCFQIVIIQSNMEPHQQIKCDPLSEKDTLYLSILFDSSTMKLITEKLSKTGFIRQIALQLSDYPLAPSVGVAKALLPSKQTLFAAGNFRVRV